MLHEALIAPGMNYVIACPYHVKCMFNEGHSYSDEEFLEFFSKYIDNEAVNYVTFKNAPGVHPDDPRLRRFIDRIGGVEETLTDEVEDGEGSGDEVEESRRARVQEAARQGGREEGDGHRQEEYTPRNPRSFSRYKDEAVDSGLIEIEDVFQAWLQQNHDGQWSGFLDEVSSLDAGDLEDYSDDELAPFLKLACKDLTDSHLEAHVEPPLKGVVRAIKSDTYDTDDLFVVVECSRALTPEEKKQLLAYISGQMSDGWGEGMSQQDTEITAADDFINLEVHFDGDGSFSRMHGQPRIVKETATDSDLRAFLNSVKSKAKSIVKSATDRLGSGLGAKVKKATTGIRRGIAGGLRRAANKLGEDIAADVDALLRSPFMESPVIDEPAVKPKTKPDVDDVPLSDPDKKPAKPEPSTNPFRRPRIRPGQEPRPKAYSPAAVAVASVIREEADFAPFLNIRNRRNRRKLRRRVSESSLATIQGISFDAMHRQLVAAGATAQELNKLAELADGDSTTIRTADEAVTVLRTDNEYVIDEEGSAAAGTAGKDEVIEAVRSGASVKARQKALRARAGGVVESLRQRPAARPLTEALDVKGATRVCHDSGCVLAELDKIRALADGAEVVVTTSNGKVKVCRKGDDYTVGLDGHK